MVAPSAAGSDDGVERNSPDRPASANLPSNVAADLQRIRARRTENAMVNTKTNESSTPADRPASLPANVTDDLKRIRATRRTRKASRVDQNPKVEIPSDEPDRPTLASLPPSVAEDLLRIRSRRTRKATIVDQRTSNAKRKETHPRSRNKSKTTQNNVRRREAGSMFFKTGTESNGWLE